MAKKTHSQTEKEISFGQPSISRLQELQIILQSKGVACCNLDKKQTSRAAGDCKQSCRDMKDPTRKRNLYKIYVHLVGS